MGEVQKDGIQTEVEAEREACAQIILGWKESHPENDLPWWFDAVALEMAKKIIARGQTPTGAINHV